MGNSESNVNGDIRDLFVDAIDYVSKIGIESCITLINTAHREFVNLHDIDHITTNYLTTIILQLRKSNFATMGRFLSTENDVDVNVELAIETIKKISYKINKYSLKRRSMVS
jgi:hypothetical protein